MTAGYAEQCWYVRQLANKLESTMGLAGFSRLEISGGERDLFAMNTPDGVALVLGLRPGTEVIALLRTLGGEA
ncbi:MAG: hypothetical protein AAGN82_21120 [Myxococcota bacterium]